MLDNHDSAIVRKMPIVGLVVAVVALFADQVSKYIMVELVMRPDGISGTPFYSSRIIEVLPVFQLRMAWNTGISFSLFDSGTTLTIVALIIVQSVIMLTILWFMWHMSGAWMQTACGLIVGGGLGNIVDRMTMGAVADFLDFFWQDWHFPTFNLADTCISVGVGMWLLDALITRPHHKVSNG